MRCNHCHQDFNHRSEYLLHISCCGYQHRNYIHNIYSPLCESESSEEEANNFVDSEDEDDYVKSAIKKTNNTSKKKKRTEDCDEGYSDQFSKVRTKKSVKKPDFAVLHVSHDEHESAVVEAEEVYDNHAVKRKKKEIEEDEDTEILPDTSRYPLEPDNSPLSPVTTEQEEVAAEVEALLGELLTSSSPVTEERPPLPPIAKQLTSPVTAKHPSSPVTTKQGQATSPATAERPPLPPVAKQLTSPVTAKHPSSPVTTKQGQATSPATAERPPLPPVAKQLTSPVTAKHPSSPVTTKQGQATSPATAERPPLPPVAKQLTSPVTAKHPSSPVPTKQGQATSPATAERPPLPPVAKQLTSPVTAKHPSSPVTTKQGQATSPATAERPPLPPVAKQLTSPVAAKHPSSPVTTKQGQATSPATAERPPLPPVAKQLTSPVTAKHPSSPVTTKQGQATSPATAERPPLPPVAKQLTSPVTAKHPSSPVTTKQGQATSPATAERPPLPPVAKQLTSPVTAKHPSSPVPTKQGQATSPATAERPPLPPVAKQLTSPVTAKHPSSPVTTKQGQATSPATAERPPLPPVAKQLTSPVTAKHPSSPVTTKQGQATSPATPSPHYFSDQDDELSDEPQVSQKGKKSKRPSRTNSKTNWCKYCNTLQTKLIRHMIKKHPETREVKHYLSITDPESIIQKKKRKAACQFIINQSNKIFNDQILCNNGTGDLIPVKKPKNEFTSDTHIICSACGGLMSRKYFAQHKDSCSKSKSLLGHKIEESPNKTYLGQPLDVKYEILKKNILDKMKNDKVSRALMGDPLILEFGRRFLKSHMADKQKYYVSNKLRTLGDLLLKMKAKFPNITSFKDVVDPSNFDNLCEVVREWSMYNEISGICEKGSVCRRLCKSLKNVSDILWSQAIKSKNIEKNDLAEIKTKHKQFLALMNSDWPIELSSAADKSVKLVKVSKEDKMPLQEDMISYFSTMNEIIEKTMTLLKEKKNEKDYNILVKLSLAYLIAFNCRRPSEVAYATLENYKTLELTNSPNDGGILGVFTVFATKNGVKVPIILPKVILHAIDTILTVRSFFKIPGQYIFCKMDGSVYNGTSVLSNSKSLAKLKKPDDFTANGLRHYWATITQLDPTIKAHMPKFLGHTTATHEKFYEMPLTKIHLHVIGPTILKHCNIKQGFPKSSTVTSSAPQTEITLNPNFKLPDETEVVGGSPQSQAGLCHTNFMTFHSPPKQSKTPRSLDKTIIQVTPEARKSFRKRKIVKQPEQNIATSSSPEQLFSDTSEDPDFLPTPKKKNKFIPHHDSSSNSSDNSSYLDIQKRNKWITPEKEELLSSIPKTILGIEPAPRGSVREMWEKSKIIKKRHSLQMTRIEVSKYFTKKKKIPTPVRKKIFETE